MAGETPFDFSGLGEDQDEMLRRELARALAMRKPSGQQYSTPLGALFGGLGDVVGAFRGGRAYDETQAKIEALSKRRADAVKAATQPQPDPLAGRPGPVTEDEYNRAMADALAGREQRASALMASGYAPLVNLGERDLSQVDATRERTLREALETRKLKSEQEYRNAQLSIDKEKLDQDLWSSIADPVTGGILMYNRKTGETRAMGPGGGRPGELGPAPGKPTEKQRNAVTAAMGNISKLDMAINALQAAPGAYGGAKNFVAGTLEKVTPGFAAPVVQAVTARQLKPDELKAKNYVTNVVSAIINERAGSSVTLNEELRQKFLPQETDGLKQALQKLRDLREMELADYNAASGKGVSATPPPTPGTSPDTKTRVQSYYED